MYKINPLYRNVLITTDEVIFHAPTKHALDPRAIQQSIIIAEERFIRPALCSELYDNIKEAKNKEVTVENITELQTKIGSDYTLTEGEIVNAMEFLNTDFLSLWKEHLWKLTAECVMLVSTPEAFIHFASEGVVHNSPIASPMNTSGVSTPELKSVRWLMDKKMMDRIDPLLEAMHDWICRRSKSASFPGYCKPCDCDHNGIAYKRKSDILLNLYDDEDTHKCGCR